MEDEKLQMMMFDILLTLLFCIIQPSKKALPPKEAAKVEECFYIKDVVLLRQRRPPNVPPDEVWLFVY
jgi:hypothetical protein